MNYELIVKHENVDPDYPFYSTYCDTPTCRNKALDGLSLCRPCTKRLGAEEDLPYMPRCSYIHGVDQCPRRADLGSSYCPSCTRNNWDSPDPENISTWYLLHFKDVPNLGSYLSDGSFSDITLQVDGRSVPAHKLILSAASPFFRTLFLSDFKKVEDHVVLEGVSPNTLQWYLQLIYGQEVRLDHWRLVCDLLDYFNMTLLQCKTPWAAIYVPPSQLHEYEGRIDELP